MNKKGLADVSKMRGSIFNFKLQRNKENVVITVKNTKYV